MRFLADQGISPVVVAALNGAGHDAVHVREIGMADAPDAEIVTHAARETRIIITEDADFGTLVVPTGRVGPSVIYFRDQTGRSSVRIRLLLGCLHEIAADLAAGSLVVIDDARVRVRRLT